jgi:hypothetical protein
MSKSQQPPALRPFPRILTAFTGIAWLTGYHQITDVVGRNISSRDANKRIGMLNGMLSPLDFLGAVVALSLLSLVLLSNLLRGIPTRYSQFTCVPCYIQCPIICFSVFRVPIFLLKTFFRCSCATFNAPTDEFPVSSFVSTEIPSIFRLDRLACRASFESCCNRFRARVLSLRGTNTFDTGRFQPTMYATLGLEVFHRGRFQLIAPHASPCVFWQLADRTWMLHAPFGASCYGDTGLAMNSQSIFRVLARMKAVQRGREKLFARCASFISFRVGYAWIQFVFFLRCLCTCTAVRAESIFLPFMGIKVGNRGGKELLTTVALPLRGIEGYTLHTSELTFHSSRLGVYQHCSGTTLLPLNYTINQPAKPVCTHFDCPCSASH